jgi:antitoxin YefM
LTGVLDEVERLHEHVVIIRNGRPAAVVLSQGEYESLMETLEIPADGDLRADLSASDEEVAGGRQTSRAEVKTQLSLG